MPNFRHVRLTLLTCQIAKTLIHKRKPKIDIFGIFGRWQQDYAIGHHYSELTGAIWVKLMRGMSKGCPTWDIVRARILMKCLGGELSPILWSNLWWRLIVLFFRFWRMPVSGPGSNSCAVADTSRYTKMTRFGADPTRKSFFFSEFWKSTTSLKRVSCRMDLKHFTKNIKYILKITMPWDLSISGDFELQHPIFQNRLFNPIVQLINTVR